LTGLGEAEVICLQDKAWRRDMAIPAPPGHGKKDSASPHNTVLRAKQPEPAVKSNRKRSNAVLPIPMPLHSCHVFLTKPGAADTVRVIMIDA